MLLDRRSSYVQLNVKVSEEGLEIYSKEKGKIAFYPWVEIDKIEIIYAPQRHPAILLLGEGYSKSLGDMM